MVPLSFAGHCFHLLCSGALWWPAQRTLLVADLHFEKASHFAARGWMLPPFDSIATLRRLAADAQAMEAAAIIALGDSFHDPAGPGRLPPAARSLLAALAAAHPVTWITGNHDPALPAGLGASMAGLQLDGLRLCHAPDPGDPAPQVAGHFHPKLLVETRGRRISRRCFVRGPARLLLPAYGALAGGLDARDPAIRAAVGWPATAHVPLSQGALSVALAA